MSDILQGYSAYIIGIGEYPQGISNLQTPEADARQLAALLESQFRYDVHLYTGEVGLEKMAEILAEIATPSPTAHQEHVLIYFAGHGIALDNDAGIPEGFLLPADARPLDVTSYLPMSRLSEAAVARDPHHLMIILDCCFAGSFKWAPQQRRIRRQNRQGATRAKFEYFRNNKCWQIITSASYDETALDSGVGGFQAGSREKRKERTECEAHSPFAYSLMRGLEGGADIVPEGGNNLITAPELILYLQQDFESLMDETGFRQMPSLQNLALLDKRENRLLHKGQYLFQLSEALDLPEAPPMSAQNNPYRGLEAYERKDHELFFGRTEIAGKLYDRVQQHPLTIVSGPSGVGKSSLVKAGLMPLLAESERPWKILPAMRPNDNPFIELKSLFDKLGFQGKGSVEEQWKAFCHACPEDQVIWLIDQFEEVNTRAATQPIQRQFIQALTELLTNCPKNLHIIFTVRGDFEPVFLDTSLAVHWKEARFLVPQMSRAELHEVIIGPASARSVFFESEELVDRIIAEVENEAGSLPLLSFALSELYLKCTEKAYQTRTITQEDYQSFNGGVVGALWSRADEEYHKLAPEARETMRNIFLRMVTLESGETLRKRVLESDLLYGEEPENKRVKEVIRQLIQTRLIVGDTDGTGHVFYEPAHDRLVEGWESLQRWIKQVGTDSLILAENINRSAKEWEHRNKRNNYLWDDIMRLEEYGFLPARKQNVVNRTVSQLLNLLNI